MSTQPGPYVSDPYQPAPQPQAYGQQSPWAAPVGYQPAEPAFEVQSSGAPESYAAYEPYPTQSAPGAAMQPYQPYAAPYRLYAAPYATSQVDDPGRTLGIAGLLIGMLGWILPLLGWFAPFLGLGLSLAGYRRSKAAGHRNTAAVAGIVISSVVIGLGILVFLGLMLFAVTAR